MPAQQTVEPSSTPTGNVEIVSEEVADRLKEAVEPAAEGAAKLADEFKKSVGDEKSTKKTIIKYIDAFKAKAIETFNVIGASAASAVSFTSKELKNPVVSSHVVLGSGLVGAIAAISAGKLHTCTPPNKWVSIAAGVFATGLVFADAAFVKKNYPKYKKT
ncbi:unnamed protein product [Kuraishia capsulata CBS 1993]|uniref:Mitochondrial outer membrane protein OM14 C-terminal domain-containing protein n=1 Tax=Kuraishia capsulata CBS 1993 TaxID=1382522 RepID=W6MW79_9ASCO|nr:uncharacterized protein KUCA_T00002957001 [Kuraishia capsulata CBS 1993]CDK26980.1 unnamed protein product [Kuraishia capsulata CBS 1993]